MAKKKKGKGRPVSRVVLFINPRQLGMTSEEVTENMEITMREALGNHKDKKISFAAQYQKDTEFMAYCFRTKGRERYPMWLSRPMGLASGEHGSHILTIVTDITPESPIAEGNQWEDIDWDQLRVVPWGRLQHAIFDVIEQIYKLTCKINDYLEQNVISDTPLGLMISVDGDRRWLPPIIRVETRDIPTEEYVNPNIT